MFMVFICLWCLAIWWQLIQVADCWLWMGKASYYHAYLKKDKQVCRVSSHDPLQLKNNTHWILFDIFYECEVWLVHFMQVNSNISLTHYTFLKSLWCFLTTPKVKNVGIIPKGHVPHVLVSFLPKINKNILPEFDNLGQVII